YCMTVQHRIDDVIDALRREYAHVKFLWITAPTPRCGITLLQRMFNAGEEAIIYGENSFLLSGLPGSLAEMFMSPGFAVMSRKAEETAEKFFAGNRGMDGTTLWPDLAAY